MGLGDYPNLISPNERHLRSVPRKDRPMEQRQDFRPPDPRTLVNNMSRLELVELIRRIDQEVSEWEFSLAVGHRYRAELETAWHEVPDLAMMSSDELLGLVIEYDVDGIPICGPDFADDAGEAAP